MTVDSRDQLWEATFDTYYNSFYQELLSDELLIRWQRVDDIAKLLVALFAGSSAITGLVNFYASTLNLEWAWPVLTGFAALVAIVHKELAVPFRLRDHGENKRSFSALRLDLETFRYLMKIDANFAVDEFTKKFEEFRKRYSEEYRRLRVDSFVTTRLRASCQSELDEKIAQIIVKT
jgi:hypothetical protein